MVEDSLGLIVHSVHRPTLLQTLLSSLEMQEDKSFRVMLINNGGSAETTDVMRRYESMATVTVQFHHLLDNAPFNLAHAANFASVVAFIGDDDVLEKNYTQQMHKLMRENPQAAMYAFGTKTISARGLPLGFGYWPFRKRLLAYPDQLGMQLADCSLIFETTGMRLNVIPEADLEISDFDYVVDWWLELLVLLNGSAAVSWEQIYRKRLHSRQVSAVANRAAYDAQRLAMMKRLLRTHSFHSFVNSAPDELLTKVAAAVVRYSHYRDPLHGSDLLILGELLKSIDPYKVSIGHGKLGAREVQQGIRTVSISEFRESSTSMLEDLRAALRFWIAESTRRTASALPFRRRPKPSSGTPDPPIEGEALRGI